MDGMHYLDLLEADDDDEAFEDLLFELVLDDDVEVAVAEMVEAGVLKEEKYNWYNAADKVKDFDEACDRLGDFHIEHFTRFTKAEIETLATALQLPPRVRVNG